MTIPSSYRVAISALQGGFLPVITFDGGGTHVCWFELSGATPCPAVLCALAMHQTGDRPL